MNSRSVVALSRRWINIVFAAIVVSFVTATAFVHLKLRAVDHAALGISTNTAPSIERLADARAELRHLQVRLDRATETLEGGAPIDVRAIHDAQRALDDRIDAYLALPILPDEREAWTRVLVTRGDVDDALNHFVAEATAGNAAVASAQLRREGSAAIGELYEALTRSIRDNASHTLEFAREIKTFREQATLLAFVLDVACAFIAVGGALYVRSVVREQEARADELEAFAGRVAHDILGPLNTVSFALELASHPTGERQRQKLSERGLAAIDRIKRLVGGLLDFARAAGRPEPGARADVRSTIEEIVTALEPVAKEKRAELRAEADTDAAVACNPGVLASVVENLARNALKYLGDADRRRVENRAQERPASVRIEVEDTGPGIPSDIGDRLFQPYVRARGSREPGLGLGLATVKRLAEGHGGAVGVESVEGRGSTFWFELPKAENHPSPV